MPEPIPAPNQPATGSGNPPAPAGSPAPAPAGITSEQLDAAIQKALNPVFATLRRLGEPAAPGTPPAAGAPAPAATGTPAQEQGIKERLQAAENQLAKGEKRLRDASIREAAAALGVEAARIPVLQAYVEHNHGKAIKLNEKDEAVYVDAFQQATSVKEWLAILLKTPEGGMFLPPKSLPNIPRGGNPPLPQGETRTYMDLSLSERLELDKPENAEKRKAYLAAAAAQA